MPNIQFKIVFMDDEDFTQQMTKLESILSSRNILNIDKDDSEGLATIQLNNLTFSHLVDLLTDADDLYDDIRIKMLADDIIVGFDSVLDEFGI